MSEYTKITYGKTAKDDLLNGVIKLAEAVKSTLGPKGETVLLKKEGKLILYTKDGVTVAESIKLENPQEDLGRQLITEVADKTDSQAGDGTTTSTVLTEAIVKEGMKSVGGNSISIKKGMDKTLERIIEEIDSMSIPIKGNLEKMTEVATISANGDRKTGELVAKAIFDVGDDGKVDIIPTPLPETEVELTEGMTYFHGAHINEYLARDFNNQITDVDDPYIIIFDEKVQKFSELVNILKLITHEGKPIIFMMKSEEVTTNVLKSTIKNKLDIGIDLTIMKCPRDTGMIDDLAVFLGAIPIGDKVKLNEAGRDVIGTCKNVKLIDGHITFTEGGGNKEVLNSYIQSLKNAIESDDLPEDRKELYRLRVAKLNGGVAKIKVGGKTEVEMFELKDRIVDSYHSTKSALEDGVVIGGGFTLLKIQQKLLKDKKFIKTFTDDELYGFKIVVNALSYPAKQILINGGFESELILDKVLRNKNKNYGFDSLNEKYCDLIKDGIIDSARNTKIALTNAVSVAELIITTNCIVRDS